jgi:hypothetical protein
VFECGFCCDGTLFKQAVSFEGEKVIPPMEQFTNTKGETWIKLPCPHFDEYCTVYNQKRPDVCGDFKCRIIFRFNKGKMTYDEAAKLISQIKQQRKRLSKLIPGIQKNEHLSHAYTRFIDQYKDAIDSKEFKIKNAQLLLEWASFEHRLSKFDTTRTTIPKS